MDCYQVGRGNNWNTSGFRWNFKIQWRVFLGNFLAVVSQSRVVVGSGSLWQPRFHHPIHDSSTKTPEILESSSNFIRKFHPTFHRPQTRKCLKISESKTLKSSLKSRYFWKLRSKNNSILKSRKNRLPNQKRKYKNKF